MDLRIRAIALVACLAIASLSARAEAVPAPAAAPAAKAGGLRRAYLKELASWRSIFRKPARLARFAITSGVSIGAGMLTSHLTGSPSAGAFVSFTSNVIADRVIEKIVPGSRPLGTPRPPTAARDAAQTLVGASVAAVATPVMMELVQHGSAPLFGLGAQLLLSRPLVQGIGGFAGGLIASGARAGFAKLMKIRPAR